MKPDELSQQLRQESGQFLKNRRRIVAFSLTAIVSMGIISLYQMGLIKHLPEPPLPRFNADKVDASPEAYAYFNTPDGVLGLGSYTLTLGLAAMGSQDRATQRPWLPLILLAKVGFDTFQASRLTLQQWTKHRAFCFWCLLASAMTFATIPQVLPEARTSFRRLTGK